MPPIVSLPMYDLSEVRGATAALAAAIEGALARCRLAGGSVRFFQTCGYPFTHDLRSSVGLVATPCYRAAGCTGSSYSSALVARAGEGHALEEFRGRTVALNAADSQSGFHALRHALRDAPPFPFFGQAVWTGAHRTSVQAVRTGVADLAAIDAVTLALLERHAPSEVAGLGVVGWTASAPALPYVVAPPVDLDQLECLREAVVEAITDSGLAAVREALLIDAVQILAEDAYDVICEMEREADGAGVRLAEPIYR